MDNLTHSLVGAVLGQAGLKTKTGLAMPALIIGANLPDIDAACFFWLDGIQHVGFRRGITHGPPAMILLPLLLAGALWWFDKWQTKRGKRPEKRLPVRFGWLYALSLIGCLSHPAMDWLNVYGVRLLEPFSSRWFYGDTLFIIDLWLIAIMAIALVFSWRREKAARTWRWPAIAGTAAALLYIGANWLTTQQAQVTYAVNSKSPAHGHKAGQLLIASPAPILSFQREIIVGERGNYSMVPAGELPSPSNAKPLTKALCALSDAESLQQSNPEVRAFFFWSRAPFAERAQDGSVILRDARFYDPRARDRFSVFLPDVKCQSL